jgi:Glycosyl transferase family 11
MIIAIIAKITGGLGNQMFQYALGRQLAETHQTLLKLDLSSFESDYRKYALHCFQTQTHLATPEEIEDVQGIYGAVEKLTLKITRKMGFRSSALRLARKGVTLKENHFHFDPSILDASKYSYLDGYWQTEKYFPSIGDILRQEFQFKYLQDSKSKHLSSLIGSTNSVALHIRRGDYVSNSKNLEFHGLCSLDYYGQAIQLMSDRVDHPHFFVFSDEPQWVKENFKLECPVTVVDHHSGDLSYEDMRLISQCQHQIIANSSFSWWAAWLNNNPQKIVIAPLKWFNNASADIKDLIPNQWLSI